MNKNSLRLMVTSACLILLVSSAVTLFLYTQPKVNAQQETMERQKRKTLRDAASERDFDVSLGSEVEIEQSTLSSVAENSRAIIIGEITDARSDFTGSGDLVETFYTVNVQRVLKDTTLEGAWKHIDPSNPPTPLVTPLKFARIGGIVEKNGHRTLLKVNGIARLKENKTYVLFLNWSTNYQAYVLTGGRSGVFAVDANSFSVEPLNSREQFVKKYQGLDLETFLKEALATN